MKFRLLAILFLLSFPPAFAQGDAEMDSLKKALITAKEDTNKVLILNELCWQYHIKGDYDIALNYAEQGKALAEKINYPAGISTALNRMGLIYFKKGELHSAMEKHLDALKIREATHDKRGQASSHHNIGNIYMRQGDYAKALEQYLLGLQIKEGVGDKKGIANSLNNIGSVYNNMHEYEKALEYYSKSLSMYEALGDKMSIADLHNNIGTVYQDRGETAKALKEHELSLSMRRISGDKEGIASSCINLATVTLKAKQFDAARKYMNEALAFSIVIGSKDDLMDSYGLLSSLDSALGNWKDAYANHMKYILYRDSIDNEENTRKMVQAEMNFNFNKTQAVQKAEQDKKDAVADAEIRKQRMILWFAVCALGFVVVFTVFVLRSYRQKQRSAKIIEEKNVELERLSLAASETDNVILILDRDGRVEWANESFTRLNGITIEDLKRKKGETIFEISNNPRIREVVDEAVAGKKSMVYESLNLNQEGKRLWESSMLTPIFDAAGALKKFVIIDTDITLRKEAEETLSVKNKDITDSITYAKRIQGAILIPEAEIKKDFSDAFVLFRPKDIVSGDFYWFAESKYNKILAVADCTGHGVPGGFMSMLGFAMLQENMMLEEVRTTADAFAALDKKITATLNRNDRTYRDGMDMVLCAFSKTEPVLEFSCANRPLIRIRNKEITEFRGDKYTIGGAIDETVKEFHSTRLDLQKGDTFYMFTDGYADQFGGEKQKKFMYKKLLETLLSVCDQPLDVQKKVLADTFDAWKSKLEQVDDVLVIGIRI